MAMRKFARSTTSGSRAAFSMMVSPSASVAAIMRFSVPGDRDGFEVQPRALEASGARADVAAFDVDLRAHGLQARDVDVHRACADGAAAGQRHVGLAEARQQRPEHQDGRAHGLHQLVGRETFPRRGRPSISICIFSSMVTDTPMRPNNSIMVVTSCRCGTLRMVTGPSASKRARRRWAGWRSSRRKSALPLRGECHH